jgi:hypothetical protein
MQQEKPLSAVSPVAFSGKGESVGTQWLSLYNHDPKGFRLEEKIVLR